MKGQTIMEYLTTYGWAIVLIIIGGAVLFRMGVFNMSWIAGDQCAPCFSDFHVKDWKFGTDGTLTIVVANKRGSTISITEVNSTVNAVVQGTNTTLPTTVAPNGETTLTFSGIYGAQAEGSQYTADLKVVYSDITSGLSHTDTATLQGAIETA